MLCQEVLLIEHSATIGRREFISRTGLLASGVAAVYSLPGALQPTYAAAEKGYAHLFKSSLAYRKWDSHNHIVLGDSTPEKILESMDRMGIEKVSLSVPQGVEPEQFRASNDKVIKAMKQYPDRIFGQCYINPSFQREALQEITRCMDQGMRQLGELYTLYKINDPVYYPIIERCIDLRISLLMHARCDLGLRRKGYPCDAPMTTSIADDFVDIAQRYPEAKIIHAHIGGGGDWEYMCKRLRSAPGIYLDTSGSVSDDGMIDFAMRYLGEDRLLFASDMNFETAIGKIMTADLTDGQRKKIFFENFNKLINRA